MFRHTRKRDGEGNEQKALILYEVIDERIRKEVLDTKVVRKLLNLDHYMVVA